MAAYSRAPLLMLLLSLPCLFGLGSVRTSKAASGPAEAANPPVVRAAEPAVKDAPAAAAAAVAAGASLPRKATGWKLSEEEACREDLIRMCPKHTWTNNLAVLECLQDKEVRCCCQYLYRQRCSWCRWACRVWATSAVRVIQGLGRDGQPH